MEKNAKMGFCQTRPELKKENKEKNIKAGANRLRRIGREKRRREGERRKKEEEREKESQGMETIV